MQKIELKSIYILCRNCSSSYTEHNKIGLPFLDSSMILSWIYKILLKHLKSEETSCTQTPARFKGSQMCPRPSPTVPRWRWRARRWWGGPRDTNKAWCAEAVGDVRLADGQWRKAARVGASVRWPHGTGLGVGNESHPVGTQCSRSPASDRRSQARSGVRARRYGGEADVARPGVTSCAWAHPTPTHFKVAMFKMNFLQILKLNRTKVWIPILSTTQPSTKLPKGLGGLDPRIWQE
jgi:hypothetical protein